MSSGYLLEKKHENIAKSAAEFDAPAFARLLLALPGVIEVKAALNAIILTVECTALNPFDGEMEETGDELDSGTWFLIRVSDLPSPDARGGLVAFVRETTLAGAEENDGEQSDENFLPT